MILFIHNNYNENKDGIEKFNAVYDAYYRYVYKIIYNIIQNADETDDIVQDVFVIIWNTLDVITDEVSAKAWISTISSNAAVNFAKKKKTAASKIINIDDDIIYSVNSDCIQDPAELVVSNDNINAIFREIKKMDKKYSDVLLLYFKFHMKPETIAGYLGRNPKTVYTQLQRGREILKQKLIPGAAVSESEV